MNSKSSPVTASIGRPHEHILSPLFNLAVIHQIPMNIPKLPQMQGRGMNPELLLLERDHLELKMRMTDV
jgi:hypothetical protein